MTTKHASMRLVCPGCGVYGTIETFASDADARAVAVRLGELQPDVAAAVQRYLRLHAPTKHALTWHKSRKLLDELVPLITAGSIRRNGRDWPAPGAAWISAIDAMLGNQNLQLPLSGHGYLLQIIAGEADKAEGKAERAVEQSRAAGQPARTLEDQTAAETIAAAHVRTATAMLVNEDARMRLRFTRDLEEDEARRLISNFGDGVIREAVAAWQRSRK